MKNNTVMQWMDHFSKFVVTDELETQIKAVNVDYVNNRMSEIEYKVKIVTLLECNLSEFMIAWTYSDKLKPLLIVM
jgi:hypothetical protein